METPSIFSPDFSKIIYIYYDDGLAECEAVLQLLKEKNISFTRILCYDLKEVSMSIGCCRFHGLKHIKSALSYYPDKQN